MPHKKGHDPQIKQAPSRFTSLVRNIKASPQAPYPFIRKALIGAAILSPSPLGKGNMAKNMASFAKQAKKVPPISKNPYLHTTKQYLKNNKNPYANTTKQYIQGIVDSRLRSSLAEATFKPRAELATATINMRPSMIGNLRSTFNQLKSKFTGPKSVKPLTNREKVTGMSEEFFKRVAQNNPDAVSRTSGVYPFIQGTGRIKDPLKRFKNGK
jgi:hypothetical protein